MSEATMSERNWRFDPIPEREAGASLEFAPGERAQVPARSRLARLARWKGLAVNWVRSRGWHLGANSASAGEEVLHEFSALVASTRDPVLIEEGLLELAARLVGGSRIEYNRDPAIGLAPDFAAGTIPVHICRSVRGQLIIRSQTGEPLELDPLTRRRLATLGTLASAALDQLDPVIAPQVCSNHGAQPHDQECPSAARQGGAAPSNGSSPPGQGSLSLASLDSERPARPAPLVPGVHDATFLNAVLPFAIGQARRRGEPLSVLCIEVDRLGGIAELLGRERADLALRATGIQVASQIRSSDFVALLDDDRLLAVLPRAGIREASRIAMSLCQQVDRNPSILPEAGGVTVSIGVAEFPACADNVFALVDAADHALSMAKRRGRNQAAAAPVLAPPDSPKLARCAS
jgi:diguanylate cyclase (GGDEF)-like protein